MPKSALLAVATALLTNALMGSIAWSSEGPAAPVGGTECKALEAMDFSGVQDAPTQVTEAKLVEPNGNAPAYCQVQGYVAPQVGFELRLPEKTWNGKFMEVGCGGWCGSINAEGCDVPLQRGYACIASDMGHKGTGEDVLWANNNVQAQIDFGYRATHVVAVSGKAIAERYYSKGPKRSYFAGCSTGGYQGVMEAQRFPWDFDGIIAGAPDIDQGPANLRAEWIARVFLDGAGKPLLTHEMLQLVHHAALARCDMDDGVRDGIIGNPFRCNFDPRELICKAGQKMHCLTASQVGVAEKLYAGPMNSQGEKTSAGGGFLPGSELMWEQFWPATATEQYFKYGVSGYSTSATWKYTDFDFDRDYKRLGLGAWYDNSNPDLRKLKQSGAKLIVYTGGHDTAVLPGSVADYYETVERTMGGRTATQAFFRLFMIPGMNHCTLGDGAFAVNWLSYLEGWVERGEAPDRLISSRVKIDDVLDKAMQGDQGAAFTLSRRLEFPLDPATIEFSRPVFPYPTAAKYLGHGDPNDANSFGPVQ